MDLFALPAGRVALRSQLPLISDSSPRAWVQLALEGEWKGHHAGEFAFTREVFDRIVQNFGRQANAVPLTYEHPDYAGDGSPIPAAGWIHELRVREGDDGAELWGHVEFTARAAGFVREGEYRFVSVVVGFASTDRETGDDCGAELYEVGLVNTPFIDGMQPIKLSRRGRAAQREVRMSDVEMVKAAIKALGDEATLEQIAKWCEAKKQMASVESGESDAGAASDAPPADLAAQPPADAVAASTDTAPQPAAEVPAASDPADVAAVDFGAAVEAIAQLMGLDASAVVALVQEHMEHVAEYLGQLAAGSGTAAEQQATMSRKLGSAQSQITLLQGQVKALQDERDARTKAEAAAAEAAAQAEAEQYVDGLVKAGKVLDAERDQTVKLARTDRAWLEQFVCSRQIVPVGERVVAKPPEAAVDFAELKEHPEYPIYWRALSYAPLTDEQRHRICVDRIRARMGAGKTTGSA